MFLHEQSDICKFADDTTLHASGYGLGEVMVDIEHDSTILVKWFRDKFLTLNANKCHLIVSRHKEEAMCAPVEDALFGEITRSCHTYH